MAVNRNTNPATPLVMPNNGKTKRGNKKHAMSTTTVNAPENTRGVTKNHTHWWMFALFVFGLLSGLLVGIMNPALGAYVPGSPVWNLTHLSLPTYNPAPMAPMPLAPEVAPLPPEPAAKPVSPVPASSTAKKLTERELALIVKNPDAHVGEKILVYGQSNGDTYASSGMSVTIGTKSTPEYGYYSHWVQAYPAANESFANVVSGDQFKAELTVIGAESNGTAAFTVDSLTITKPTK